MTVGVIACLLSGCSGPTGEDGGPPSSGDSAETTEVTTTTDAPTTLASSSTAGAPTTTTAVPTTTAAPTTTTTTAPAPALKLTVEVDSNQINYYAVASSTSADFLGETLACARRGKKSDNERYCYLFPTQEALDAANVDPDTGEFELPCWIGFGGAGVSSEKIVASDIMVPERWSYDIVQGCPPY